jgi:hypothetical protein
MKAQAQIPKGNKQTTSLVPTGLLQGKKGPTGMEEESRRKRQMLQRRAVNDEEVSEVPPIVREVLSSPGQPLDKEARDFFEPRFRHDFSQVRVHTDSKAAESVQALNALAYTVGRDVVFGAGQYAPETIAGRRLMAHELTHVVQQGRTTSESDVEIDVPDAPAELEALQVMNGNSNGYSPRRINQAAVAIIQRHDNDPTRRGRGTPAQRPSVSTGTGTGFQAWNDFIMEKIRELANPVGMSPTIILIEERTLQRMNELLRRNSNAVNREMPLIVYVRIQREVMAEMERQPESERRTERPAPPSQEEFNRRLDPYQVLAEQLSNYRNRTVRLVREPWEQRFWLVRENAVVQDVLNLMGQRLVKWAIDHIDIASQQNPRRVLAEIASDPEIQAMFRAAQRLPLEAESFSTAADVPLWQRMARIAWGFIPIIGDATDLTEALSGWDILERRPLTGAERVIMLLGALLPLVPGSALRGGREGATELAERLARQSAGHTAAEFERAIRAADAIAPQATELQAAIQRIRRGGRLTEQELQNMEGLARRVEASNSGATGATASAASRTAARATTQAARTIDRLALNTIPNITAAERSVLSRMGEDAWTRVLDYARSNRNVFSVKGKIAEELFTFAPEFSSTMQRAMVRAASENIPSSAIQFVRDIRGLAATATSPGQFAELADGAIVAVQGNRVRILTVFESKSPSNLRELARRPGEVLGQVGWDFERFRELPIQINGRIFQPSQVVVSRVTTEWLGVAPPGLALTAQQLQAIRRGMPGFQLFHGPVCDDILNAIATRLLGLLH